MDGFSRPGNDGAHVFSFGTVAGPTFAQNIAGNHLM
jgi:hypothetical protein